MSGQEEQELWRLGYLHESVVNLDLGQRAPSLGALASPPACPEELAERRQLSG